MASLWHNFKQRIKIALRIRLCLLVDFLVILLVSRQISNPKKALIVRLDAIGDYVLFRNLLTELAQSPLYGEYDFYFCGNTVWRDLHEFLDAGMFKKSFFINRKAFLENMRYRWGVQSELRRMGFDWVLEPTHSRLWLLGDALCRCTGAAIRIAETGNTDNTVGKEKALADAFFSHFVSPRGLVTRAHNPPPDTRVLFEFERNKRVAQQALQLFIPQSAPFLTPVQSHLVKTLQTDYLRKKTLKAPYIALFIGASEAYKRWPVAFFAEVALHLLQKESAMSLVLLGAPDDTTRNQELVALLSEKGIVTEKTYDLSGQTTLPELLAVISGAHFLLTNETSAVHFAVLTQTKCVCVANGRHLGRFSPYVPSLPFLSYVFPPAIETEINKAGLHEALKAAYCQSNGLPIASISPQIVQKSSESVIFS